MTSHHALTLGEVDIDGAVQETAERAGVSRSDALKRAALGGSALIGGASLLGALPASALGASARSSSDIDILNFALTLEYLEAAFYAEAVSEGALKGEAAKFAKVVGNHEAAHVAFLKKALGAKAVAKPTFDFKGTTAARASFLKTAMALEDTGVAAYAGQGPLLKNKAYVAAALSVHSVEARHAAWVRDILGSGGAPSPAPAAFDAPKTKAQILKIVTGTGFITG